MCRSTVDCETNYFPNDTSQAKYGCAPNHHHFILSHTHSPHDYSTRSYLNPDRYGCAPNQYESWPTVFDLNAQAGDGRDATLVLEFAEDAIKVGWHSPLRSHTHTTTHTTHTTTRSYPPTRTVQVWHFVAGEAPADLLDDAPTPAHWDNAKLWAYYPIAASECPGAETIGAQNLVINLAFCGEWAGQDGQSGRLGEAIAGLRGLISRQLKAWGCPPHS